MVGVSRVSKDNFRVQYIQLTLKNYDRYLLPLWVFTLINSYRLYTNIMNTMRLRNEFAE